MDTLLKHSRLLKLYRAVVTGGLVLDRVALLAGIAPRIVATLPTANSPGAQVLLDLTTLNRLDEPDGGEPPLWIWLLNALALLGPVSEEAMVRRIKRDLERIFKKNFSCCIPHSGIRA